MIASSPSVLLIGYGNPGCRDDGLGPAVADAIAARRLAQVNVETPYQLQVEDAATIADHDMVIFIDADAEGAAPFTCRTIEASSAPPSWTTHAQTPQALLALAASIFDARPAAWLIGVRGYDFEQFNEELTTAARANLDAAVAWLEPRLRTRQLQGSVA